MTRNLEVEINYFLGKLERDFSMGEYNKCLDLILEYKGENRQKHLNRLKDSLVKYRGQQNP